MITIQKATEKEIESFNTVQWHNVDSEHYGKPVEWDEESFIYKAEEDGEIVGTVTGKYEAGVVYIDELVVAKDKWGRGIGSRLLATVESYLKQKNGHKIHLITGSGWDAEKFYIALGFKKITVLPKHHFKRDFIVYEKLSE